MHISLPLYLSVAFLAITALTFVLFLRAVPRSSRGFVAVGLSAWLLLQGVLAYRGFFLFESSVPPRFALAIAPPLLLLVVLFATKGGRRWLDGLSLVRLTWLNTVRVGVELVLLGLFMHKTIPQVMTFEGRNADILVGITAPLVAWFGYHRKSISPRMVLAWNMVALCILLNVVIHGVLSVPTPFQQISFEQPLVALLYFPFNWLPAFIVPVALLTHLVSIRQLTRRQAFADEQPMAPVGVQPAKGFRRPAPAAARGRPASYPSAESASFLPAPFWWRRYC